MRMQQIELEKDKQRKIIYKQSTLTVPEVTFTAIKSKKTF